MDNMIFTSEVCGVVLIAPFDKISRPPCSTIRFIVFLSLFFRCFYPFFLYHRTFLLTVVTIMTAGTGAALHQAFGLPPWLCGLLFALLIAALSLSGLRGMISIFSFAAPALVLCTVGLGAGALLLLPACPPPAFQGGVGWLPSAMAFSAYNSSALWQSWPPWGGRSRQGALQGELAWAVPCFSWWPRRFCLS